MAASGTAYTIDRPSSVHTIHSQIQIHGSGSLFVCMPVQDYIPPQTENLSVWTDFGDENQSNTRCARPVPSTFSARPALMATGSLSTLSNVQVTVGGDSSSVTMGTRADRGILCLGSKSTGVQAQWGPLSSNWTFSVFLCLTSPVSTFGNYSGAGPIKILNSVSVGIVVNMPTGGSIGSVHAAASSGGPIDGVLAAWPWDAALANQWRCITVVNNANSGTRTIYVDGCTVVTEPASVVTIPSNTSLLILPSCSVAIAEFIIWNSATITQSQMQSLVSVMRTKWDVNPLPNPPSNSVPSSVILGPPLALQAATTLPWNLPSPKCWLDPGLASTVFVDITGRTNAGAYQVVRVLRDRGTLGCHCLFPDGAAVWGTGPLHTVQQWPVLIVSGTGTFTTSPLQGLSAGGGYTIVACHRYVDGGHPFALSTAAVLGPTKWEEYIGTNTPRNMPATDITLGDIVVVCWHHTGAGSILTHSLTTSCNPTGLRWSGVGPTVWTPVGDPKVGGTAKGLHLCELLVWQTGSEIALHKDASGGDSVMPNYCLSLDTSPLAGEWVCRPRRRRWHHCHHQCRSRRHGSFGTPVLPTRC